MSNTLDSFPCIVTYSYEKYYQTILNYIANRIPDKADAEDLTHDVFLKLMEYKQMLRKDTIKCFLYTIARNTLTDHLRRYVRWQEFTSYMYDYAPVASNTVEEHYFAQEIRTLEFRKLETFPTQRKKIYYLCHFEHQTTKEVADRLNLSKRTVESHLQAGRKVMRAYISQCI